MSKSEEERKELQRRRSLEWYYRNRERCMARHRMWYSTMTEDQREKNKARNRKWYAEHKEEQKVKRKAYRAAHMDELREKARARYSPEKVKAYRERPEVKAKRRAYKASPEVKARAKSTKHRWYLKNKTHVLEYSKEYYRTHPQFRDYRNTLSAQYNAERDERCREDPEYYAKVRAYDRIRGAKQCISEGRVYKARPSRRIPDDTRKGDLLLRDCQQAISRAEMYQSGLWVARRAI